MTNYIIVTGGVLSGLGKGVVSSSIGRLLVSCGYSVSPIKFDGYLNVDAGTINPFEHGEVFVLDDGTECDMDFGNYERFIGKSLNEKNSLTGGKIFYQTIKKERTGEFLGKTVQFIPHITNGIKDHLRMVASKDKADFVIIEVGGTIGDIENGYFIEAIRQFATEEKCFFIHLTPVPIVDGKEQKTKPTQHSVITLRSLGIQPNMIIARCDQPLLQKTKSKIAMFCGITEKAVISDHQVDSVYAVPSLLHEQNVLDIIQSYFQLEKRAANLSDWNNAVENSRNASKEVNIGLVGKYAEGTDTYVSIVHALHHSAAKIGVKLNIVFIESTNIEDGKIEVADALKNIDGIVVPGGFGIRGVEGKITVAKYAREHNIPYLGLCFGLQIAVIEFARNVCGLKDAHSTELVPNTPHPVVTILPNQKYVKEMGASMRLGGRNVLIKDGSKAASLYRSDKVRERFRHRYEVNPIYIKNIEEKGMVFSGRAEEDETIMQLIELPQHKFFFATQFHPEFLSTPTKPHPLFMGIVEAASKK